MERIKSINDVQGNVNLHQINDIEIIDAVENTRYNYIEAKPARFFGIYAETPEIFEWNGSFSTKFFPREEVLQDDQLFIIENKVMHCPEVVISFIGSEEKRWFYFDNIKQANKFSRELTKLLAADQKWLKLV